MLTRRSEPKLATPAPSAAELAFAIEAAATAPDHRSLTPYRMVAIWPDAAGAIISAIELERPADAERARVSFSRAPLFVAVIASPDSNARTSIEEQRDAAVLVTGYLLLALRALGYGSMWRTGRLVHDPVLADALELAEHERIVALVGVGTSLGLPPHPRERRPRFTQLGSADSQETFGQA